MNAKVREVIDLLNRHAEAIKDEPAREVLRLYKYNICLLYTSIARAKAYSCYVSGSGSNQLRCRI